MSGATPARTAGPPLAACRRATVVHGRGEAAVTALREAALEVSAGERLALVGPSGSGKTTLLHLLGGLITPTSGEVLWRGAPLATLDEEARRSGRAAGGIAFVFQGSALLPTFTSIENVAFAAAASGEDADERPIELLTLVGLREKLDALPAELSGGEAQRVAIARALAQRPALLLCDEPTGQLDSDTGARVLDLIDALQGTFGFALVIATHAPDVAARADRVVELADGRARELEMTA